MKLEVLFDFKIKALFPLLVHLGFFFLFQMKIAMNVKAVTASTAGLWLPSLTCGKS